MIKTRLKTSAAVISTLILSSALAACGSGAEGSDGEVPDEILIGGIHPRTGPTSYYGLPMDQGVQLALKEINEAGGLDVGGKSVKLKYQTEDDKADPTAGVAAFKKLTTSGADFVIGPLGGAVVNALKPIVASSDALLLIDGAADPSAGLLDPEGMFRWPPSYVSMDEELLAAVADAGYGEVGILNDQANPTFADSVDGLAEDLASGGATVTGTKTFSTGDSDFKAQLTALVGGTAPDALIIRGYGLESTLATVQARELGYTGPVIWEVLAPETTVADNADESDLQGVTDVIYATPDILVKLGNEKAIAFSDKYTAEFDEAPGALSAYSYDVVKSLAAAIEAADSVEPKEVGEALHNLKVEDVDLVNAYEPQESGLLLDETGQAENIIVRLEWDGGWQPVQD